MRNEVQTIVMALVVLALAARASAATRLVASGGSDWQNDCLSNPCATVSHAVAVAKANDTIAVGAGEFHAVSTIAISTPLTIAGADPLSTAVIGTGSGRVFDITANVKVSMTGLDIRGGWSSEQGGGIRNGGTLILKHVHVRDNEASCGGGISNQAGGTLTMTDVLIDGNGATGDSTCAHGGGGILNENLASATLVDSYVLNNSAFSGGGGGIRNFGKLIVARVLIWSNHSDGSGGGIATSDGLAQMINTTLSANTAGSTGGAVSADGPIELTHVTITGNFAESGAGGIFVGKPAGYASLRNTIVGNNSGDQCERRGLPFSVKVEIGGAGSIVSDASCNLWPGYNQVADPLLAPLGFNGGKTPTHALLPTSPAIDAGSKWFCLVEDQREFPRPVDGDGDGVAKCDVGAFEYGSEAAAPGPQPFWQKALRRGPWFPQGVHRPIRRTPGGSPE